jgi:1-acyl-sn-glycerol-3-phosphate acyltransferase
MRLIARALLGLTTRTTARGLDHLPPTGPLLVVFNHLGHLDGALVVSLLPYSVEAVALADLFHVPLTGQMLRLYGAIAVHRDVVDRDVVERCVATLKRSGVVALAPEARMSVTGALEKARPGAAYLALKTGAPILPIALSGTENSAVYGAWRRRRRPRLTATIGEAFRLPELPLSGPQRRESLAQASNLIMTRLAALLPAAYRGVYTDAVSDTEEHRHS